jgi:DnaK suppressor protein
MDPAIVRARLAHECQRLEDLRASLTESGIGSRSEKEDLSELSVVDQHPADIGTETFERERDMSLLEQIEAELRDVRHALRRLEEGTYGLCEACGRPIGDDRLEAQPAARFCAADQAAAEREAQGYGST